MFRFLSAAALLALAAAQSQQTCDPSADCKFRAVVNGAIHNWDFSTLCQESDDPNDDDYEFNDGLGHNYYANICGAAAKQCLPKGWTQTYEYGVAVQTWGDKPACNMSDPTSYCLDHNGLIPTCCSEDCQILGVGVPIYKLADPSNPKLGVNATFQGAPPDDDDPFWCPWNPATGSQYPRTVTFFLQCDMNVNGAIPVMAQQNKTEQCDYLLVFASNLACPDVTARPRPNPRNRGGLGGGAIFAIVFFTLASVYIVAGMLWTYKQERAWYFPNRFFWSSVGNLVGKGYTWILYCGKGSDASSFSGGAGPYSAGVSTSAAKPGLYSAGSYNSAAPTAYTDL